MDDGLIDRFKALAGPLGWIDGASDDARPYLSNQISVQIQLSQF